MKNWQVALLSFLLVMGCSIPKKDVLITGEFKESIFQKFAKKPEDVTDIKALINKQYGLPKGYSPEDLVYPDVYFLFQEKIEKRKLRREAAKALEKLFGQAKAEQIFLAGVSGFRSEKRQAILFDQYVKKNGLEKAKKFSAEPGYSEHQTGLAIDVSGKDGKDAVTIAFEHTPEARWLADNAHRAGFIIRYPKGKEEITKYQYEPWHIRYVGEELAGILYQNKLTLEEYYQEVQN